MARAGAEVVVIVTGWRYAAEFTLGMVAIVLMADVWLWFQTGNSMFLSNGTPSPARFVIFTVVFSIVFGIIYLRLWQRIELRAEMRELRVANIHTWYRWRTYNASDIVRVEYFESRRSITAIILTNASGTPIPKIMEDSFFTFGTSRFFKKIVGFIREHSPKAYIAAELTDSNA